MLTGAVRLEARAEDERAPRARRWAVSGVTPGDEPQPGSAGRTPTARTAAVAGRPPRPRSRCPAGPTCRRSIPTAAATSAASPGSAIRWPRRWPTPTTAGSSTATSSRSTSCSTPPGVVWVTDFGLAKTDEEGLTHTGDSWARSATWRPSGSAASATPRADVYALGLTLYELLALRPAFESPDRLKLIEQVTPSRSRPRPRSIDPRIPRDLETIVLKAIDKDPRGRYPSAEALAEDLQRFLEDRPIRARRVSSAERLLRWGRRNKARGRPAREPGRDAGRRLHRQHGAVDPGRSPRGQRGRALRGRWPATCTPPTCSPSSRRGRPATSSRMGELLGRHIPERGQTDWRGFEWYVFRRRFQRAQPIRTLPLSDTVWDLAATPNGQTVAVLSTITPNPTTGAGHPLGCRDRPGAADVRGDRRGRSMAPWPCPRTGASSPRGASSTRRDVKDPSSTSGTRRRASCGRAWAARMDHDGQSEVSGPGLLARRQDAALGQSRQDDQALGSRDRSCPEDVRGAHGTCPWRGRLARRPPDRLRELRQDGEALGRGIRRSRVHVPQVLRRPHGTSPSPPATAGTSPRGASGRGPGCGT